MKRPVLIFIIFLILSCFPWISFQLPILRDPPPLSQSVYVWQRDWKPDVSERVIHQSHHFDQVCYLAAEITWTRDRYQIAMIQPDFLALKTSGQPIAIVIRIGVWHGPFRSDDWRMDLIASVAGRCWDEARAAGLNVTELQLDFDSPESQLKGYRTWIAELQDRLSPLKISFTALPAWLDHPDFPALARQAPNYVLQVHSLRTPKHIRDKVQLCDPIQSVRWAFQANELGVDYRIALPTYGYFLAFDASGKFVRPYAEQSLPYQNDTWTFKRLEAQTDELAALIARWERERPLHLTGVIWYRLPIRGEQNNWNMLTLKKVMQGQSPRESMAWHIDQHPPLTSIDRSTINIQLINTGETLMSLPESVEIQLTPSHAGPIHVHSAYSIKSSKIQRNTRILKVRLKRDAIHLRLESKQILNIGWLSGSHDTEVVIHASPDISP